MASPDAGPTQTESERQAERAEELAAEQLDGAVVETGASASPVEPLRRDHDGEVATEPQLVTELADQESDRLEALGSRTAEIIPLDAWAEAAADARAVMLQDAYGELTSGLGVVTSLPLTFADDYVSGRDCGSFNPETRQVELGAWLLDHDDPSTAIRTVAHEGFHAFQERVVAGELPHERQEAWRASWQGPRNFDDFDAYMSDPLEADAFAIEEPFMRGYLRQEEGR